jgi:UDP-N-acetyl-2-amino-2-deoxyglucuronate dehydrogenase
VTLRFGLIGSGLAGPLFGGAFATRPGGAELTAVATRHEDSAREAARTWGAERWYADWRHLVADPNIDAVCIATPTGTHAEIAVAAAEAGKHVLTEKPMASTTREADMMIAACERARVSLGVIYMYRFMEPAIKMKRAIDQGSIGGIILAECTAKSFRDQAYYDSGDWRGNWQGEGGGSLMTQTSHTIDLLLWMLGDVVELAGFWTTTSAHRIEVDDMAVASLRFVNGALGTIISSTAIRPPSERTLTIHGEEGTVGLVGDQLTQWDVPGGPDNEAKHLLQGTAPDRGDTASTPNYVDSELHRRQIEDFVSGIRDGRKPLVDGLEGRRSLAVIEAIYRSRAERAVVSLGENGAASDARRGTLRGRP